MKIKILSVLLFVAVLAPAINTSDPQSVIQFLDQTVTWYHRVVAEREIASTPGDMVFVEDSVRIANQVVRSAFDFARSQEQLIEKQKNAGQNESQPTSRYEALTDMGHKLDAQVQQTEQELESTRRQAENATGRKRQDLNSTVAELQSELQLLQARRDVVHTMVEFVGSTTEGVGAGGLAAEIEALSHSVPPALSAPANTANRADDTRPAASITAPNRPEPSGLWGLITNVAAASRKMRVLDDDIQQTNSLAQACKQLQTPLLNQLRQMTQQSETIAAQADTANRSGLVQEKLALDNLTSQFKLVSASFVPLSKQSILLDLYSRNLTSWRSALKAQAAANWKDLLLRLLTLALVLSVVFGIAALWRRAIFRYVHDTRRRYQMLLLRRIALWVAIVLVIAFSFATELGSAATFAGLLTAGVAVALQNVILSVAGYFFLIGKFGVRVGDRVQIGGVTGEVVDIGLVRIHVMELGGIGRDLQPTGRVVAFSNAFVFQPTAGMFKQIPGTNLVWHEMTLTLAFESDYRSVEERMIRAVDTAFAEYVENLERQRMLMETNLGSVNIGPLRPRTALRLAASGLEVKISFPVEAQNAAEIDARVTGEILRELDREPKLRMVGSDIPTIRQITDLSGSKAVAPPIAS
jgi:small-conductance mechanosensitive channel